jgi:hypothetical protein
LVEQRIRNAWVVGSNPILGSLYFLLPLVESYQLANIQKGGLADLPKSVLRPITEPPPPSLHRVIRTGILLGLSSHLFGAGDVL